MRNAEHKDRRRWANDLSRQFRVPTSALRVDRVPVAQIRLPCTSVQRYLAGVKSGLRTDPSQWTDERHRRGIAGEEQAIRYLLSRGCTIVAHRFRVGHTEIDLIARQGDLVTFVEVKTRRGRAFGSPLEAVTGAKRRELVKAARVWVDPARVWVDRFGKPPDIYRFDCIAIVDGKLEHLADAFRPGWR